MDTIRVNLGNRGYDIHIGSDLITQVGDLVQPLSLGRHLGLVTHPALAEPYGSVVADSLRRAGHEVSLLTVPPGEESKSLEEAVRLSPRLAEPHLNLGILYDSEKRIAHLEGQLAAMERGVRLPSQR